MIKGKAFVEDSPEKLVISCEDYDVEAFDGCDYEFTYTFTGENREKLRGLLEEAGCTGSMEEMILAYFGASLDRVPVSVFCEEHGLRYDLFTWVS